MVEAQRQERTRCISSAPDSLCDLVQFYHPLWGQKAMEKWDGDPPGSTTQSTATLDWLPQIEILFPLAEQTVINPALDFIA